MLATKEMPVQPANLQNPVVIARLALTKLARTAIPPTPENYAKEYKRAAGLPDDAFDDAHSELRASEGAETLLSLVETIGLTTTGLTAGIERFDGDLKTMFDEVDQRDPEGVRDLIKGLSASRLALQKTVETSRLELDTTRKRLDQVTAELERSRALARIDPLTGSANRRGMEEIVEREISRARRCKTPLCLAILDIDHFKRVNDEHGHDTGDRALIHLVTVIKSGLRDTDQVCRYGGEEFAVVLPDSRMQGALFVVERLRVMIETAHLPIASGTLQICFSAGIAEFAGNDNRDSVLKRADEALFAAKCAGRNRVFVERAATAD
jgi:diguanylate cyclase